eukprot:m.151390 g.151390  ORF g.151390 m.151390 type:complete len:1429 (+) comp14291_c0_seq3:433-4719(+)
MNWVNRARLVSFVYALTMHVQSEAAAGSSPTKTVQTHSVSTLHARLLRKFRQTNTGCSDHSDCPGYTYCDTANSCYSCDYCVQTFNDAIDGRCPEHCILPITACRRQLDLAFLLDGSSSLSPLEWQASRRFVEQVVNHTIVDTAGTRIAIGVFSSTARVQLTFLNGISGSAVRGTLGTSFVQPQGTTNLGLGLETMAMSVFTHTAGMRSSPAVPRMLIVLTDGHSTDAVSTAGAAAQLRALDVQIVSIGIGNSTDVSELASIAGDTRQLYNVSNFDQLSQLVDDISTVVCQVNDSDCPSYLVQIGTGSVGTFRNSNPSETHSVSCCADIQQPEFNAPASHCTVFSGQRFSGSCLSNANWSAAVSFCVAAGGRLCTPLELVNGCGLGSDCASIGRGIWSSSLSAKCTPPSFSPTTAPSLQPSANPTVTPTFEPSRALTRSPTPRPTHIPTAIPSDHPTHQPSRQPTMQPTTSPSFVPTVTPQCMRHSDCSAGFYCDVFSVCYYCDYCLYNQNDAIDGQCPEQQCGLPTTTTAPSLALLPFTNSMLSCRYTMPSTESVVQARSLSCTITVQDDSGPTIGAPSDFVIVVNPPQAGTVTPIQAPGNGSLLTFTVSSNGPVGTTMEVAGQVVTSGALQPLRSGPIVLPVVGIPSSNSVLSCAGASAAASFARVSEVVQCTISVRDSLGTSTTGFATDFGPAVTVPANLNQSSPRAVASLRLRARRQEGLIGSATMEFEVQSPTSIQPFSVIGALASGQLFLEGAVFIEMVGSPTNASRLDCSTGLPNSREAVLGSIVMCTIAVENATGTTTALPSDFILPDGGNVIVVGGGLAGSLMQFSVLVTGTIGDVVVVSPQIRPIGRTPRQNLSSMSIVIVPQSAPTTIAPTVSPTHSPTSLPSQRPSENPTAWPSASPTSQPTQSPTTFGLFAASGSSSSDDDDIPWWVWFILILVILLLLCCLFFVCLYTNRRHTSEYRDDQTHLVASVQDGDNVEFIQKGSALASRPPIRKNHVRFANVGNDDRHVQFADEPTQQQSTIFESEKDTQQLIATRLMAEVASRNQSKEQERVDGQSNYATIVHAGNPNTNTRLPNDEVDSGDAHLYADLDFTNSTVQNEVLFGPTDSVRGPFVSNPQFDATGAGGAMHGQAGTPLGSQSRNLPQGGSPLGSRSQNLPQDDTYIEPQSRNPQDGTSMESLSQTLPQGDTPLEPQSRSTPREAAAGTWSNVDDGREKPVSAFEIEDGATRVHDMERAFDLSRRDDDNKLIPPQQPLSASTGTSLGAKATTIADSAEALPSSMVRVVDPKTHITSLDDDSDSSIDGIDTQGRKRQSDVVAAVATGMDTNSGLQEAGLPISSNSANASGHGDDASGESSFNEVSPLPRKSRPSVQLPGRNRRPSSNRKVPSWQLGLGAAVGREERRKAAARNAVHGAYTVD